MIDNSLWGSDYKINTGRPDVFHENRKHLKKIHDYIKNCDYPIAVNNFFEHLYSIIDSDKEYMTGGRSFVFHFKTNEDLVKFKGFLDTSS